MAPLTVHESECHCCRFCNGNVIMVVGDPKKGTNTMVYHADPVCELFKQALDKIGKREPKFHGPIHIYGGSAGDA